MTIRTQEDIENRPQNAMRHFSHKIPKEEYSRTSKLERYCTSLFPIALIASISIAGIWAGFQYNKSNKTQAQTRANTSQAARPSSDTDQFKSNFIEQYTAAKVASPRLVPERMEASGTYLDNDGIHIFNGSFDLAGNGTFQIDQSDALEFKFVNGILISKTSSSSKANADAIRTFVYAIQDPLLALNNNDQQKLEVIESTQYMGKEAYAAQIKLDKSNQTTTLIVNSNDYSLLELQNQSTSRPSQIYRYSEYKNVAGIRLPFTILIKNNKEGPFRINLTSLRPEGTSHQMANLLN
jgi:hypothetical protein